MKNNIEMYINEELHNVYGEDAFLPLSEYLRTKAHLKGTKEVCIEGDCGACTILVGKHENGGINYKTIDSCICYIYQLNQCHIVTVEGIIKSELNSVQEAMIKNHGAQCGYCTPGIVVSLYSFFNSSLSLSNGKTVSRADIQNTLVGNLCRCTGYETIIEAALSVDHSAVDKINDIYPANSIQRISGKQEDVVIEADGRKFFEPATLQEALKLKHGNKDAKLLAGGTDLHVMSNKKDFNPQKIIFLSNLKELRNIEVIKNYMTVGAGVTLAEFELFASKYYPGLKYFLELFASPQIKNIATLIGNIANASPIGDTLPFLFVMDSELVLESVNGRRNININDFYKGYKSLAIEPDEIITHVNIPLLDSGDVLRLYKVSKRKYLDISSFSAAIRMKKENEKIESIAIAFGGVGPTIQRIKTIEQFLQGKIICKSTFEEASRLIDNAINPISDVRGAKEYRLQLAKNSLMKFYFEIEKDLVLSA